MTGHPDHVFWPDDLDLSQTEVSLPWITGHRQVVDAYLIGLADRNDGELVTLDRRLKNSVASSRLNRLVTLITAG
jgi:predicted nucleic acid-binding protein